MISSHFISIIVRKFWYIPSFIVSSEAELIFTWDEYPAWNICMRLWLVAKFWATLYYSVKEPCVFCIGSGLLIIFLFLQYCCIYRNLHDLIDLHSGTQNTHVRDRDRAHTFVTYCVYNQYKLLTYWKHFKMNECRINFVCKDNIIKWILVST